MIIRKRERKRGGSTPTLSPLSLLLGKFSSPVVMFEVFGVHDFLSSLPLPSFLFSTIIFGSFFFFNLWMVLCLYSPLHHSEAEPEKLKGEGAEGRKRELYREAAASWRWK